MVRVAYVLRGGMRLTSVKLSNYRSASDAQVDLDERITILIGRNGSGKTTVLDAIAVCLESIRKMWPHGGDSHADIPRIPNSQKHNPKMDSNVSIKVNVSSSPITDDEPIFEFAVSSSQSRSSSYFTSSYRQIRKKAGSGSRRPLFVYYRQDRAFEAEKSRATRSSTNYSFEDPLFGELKPIGDLQEWWDKRDADEARRVRDGNNRDYRDIQLEAIRNLVKEIESFNSVYFSSTEDPPGLYFTKHDGVPVHISNLSSGERSYIILLADLARRLQMSDPKSALREIEGIILIDEIELNLHPAWQSAIIPTLRRVFESCQFVVATHSPQVLSAIESKCVRILERKLNGSLSVSIPKSTRGRSINYLLEGVFQTSERSPDVDRLIYEFNEAIDNGDGATAAMHLEKIIDSIEGSAPELIVLKKRLKQVRDKK